MVNFDLELLKAEGWRVHIKRVKDKKYKYIIAQRTPPGQTKRVSKSLGRYTEKLWKECEALGMTPNESVKRVPVEIASSVESSADLQKQDDASSKKIEDLSLKLDKASSTIKEQNKTIKEKNKLIKSLQKKNSSLNWSLKKIKDRDFGYTLSKNQFSRLSGILHLEGGKDASTVMDGLLEGDLKFRKYGISFAKLRKIFPFLDAAFSRKWTPKTLVDCMTGLWNQGIHTQSPKLVKKLIELVQIIQDRKWTLNNFVTYATEHHNQVYWYGKYKRGEISEKEAEKRLSLFA